MRFLGATPSNGADLTTKSYVDSAAVAGATGGMLAPCHIVTQGSETYTISAGSVTQIAGTTINGYSPQIGDRVLIGTAPSSTGTGTGYNLSNTAPNGVYTVTGNTTNISLSRASDMSGSNPPSGKFVWNQYGDWSGRTLWFCQEPQGGSHTYGTGTIQFRPVLGGNGDSSIFALNTWLLWINGNSNKVKLTQNSAAVADQEMTFPAVTTDTLVSRTSTDTLTGKTVSGYSNTIVAGMLMPVQLHTRGTETFTVSSGSVTSISGTTIDGYSPAVGDRILIPNAPTSDGTAAGKSFSYAWPAKANGIYTVTSLSGGNIAVSRAADMSGSIKPTGLSAFSQYTSGSWMGGAIWTVVYPDNPASWYGYGTSSIQFKSAGGLSISPDRIYLNNGDDWSFAWSNGTGSTRLNPMPNVGDQTLLLPPNASGTILSNNQLPPVNGNSALQTQATTAGTSYYITNSTLTVPATPVTGIAVGTRFVWRVAMMKTAAGTGAFSIIIYRGTNGSTSDTADVTQSIGTQTAAVDNMVVDVEVVVTATGATGSYWWSIVPVNKAVTATGFGVATGTSAFPSGTKSSVALNTASLKFGLGFSGATGTPTITIPFVQANAYNLI